MAEIQIADMATKAAPNSRVTKDSERFELLAVNATFNGSGAAGDFLPCVEVISDAGKVVSRTFAESVTAGDSAEVTFAPFLRKPTTAGGSGIQFDTEPQTGDWLHVTTTGDDGSGQGADFENVNTLLLQSDTLVWLLGEILLGGGNVDVNGGGTERFNVSTGNVFIQAFGSFISMIAASTFTVVAGTSLTLKASGGNITLGRVPAAQNVNVIDHTGAQIFRVDENGDLHGKTGKALVFDL